MSRKSSFFGRLSRKSSRATLAPSADEMLGGGVSGSETFSSTGRLLAKSVCIVAKKICHSKTICRTSGSQRPFRYFVTDFRECFEKKIFVHPQMSMHVSQSTPSFNQLQVSSFPLSDLPQRSKIILPYRNPPSPSRATADSCTTAPRTRTPCTTHSATASRLRLLSCRPTTTSPPCSCRPGRAPICRSMVGFLNPLLVPELYCS